MLPKTFAFSFIISRNITYFYYYFYWTGQPILLDFFSINILQMSTGCDDDLHNLSTWCGQGVFLCFDVTKRERNFFMHLDVNSIINLFQISRILRINSNLTCKILAKKILLLHFLKFVTSLWEKMWTSICHSHSPST